MTTLTNAQVIPVGLLKYGVALGGLLIATGFRQMDIVTPSVGVDTSDAIVRSGYIR